MGVYAMADGDGESKGPRSTMYAPARPWDYSSRSKCQSARCRCAVAVLALFFLFLQVFLRRHPTPRHGTTQSLADGPETEPTQRSQTTRSGTEQQRGDCETATHRKHLASDQAINSRTCVEGRGDGCEREELQTSESVMVMVSAATVLLLFG